MKILKRKTNPLVMILILLGIGVILGCLTIGAENPESLQVSMRIETDKDLYLVGENVTISLYFVNDEGIEITVDTLSYRLEIHNSVDSRIFIMGRMEMRNGSVIIPQYEERLIDIYIWNQIDFNGNQVPTDTYTISASLFDYALEGEKTFQIV